MIRRISLLFTLLLLPMAARAEWPLRQYLSIRGAASPTVAPNGSEIAFLSSITGTAQVWKMPAEGGWPDQMTFFPSSVSSVRWSPTGEWLLVAADQDGNEQFQLYLLNAQGIRLIPLTENPKVRVQFGGWSADGKTIFYASNARDPRYFDCYLREVPDGKERLIFQKDSVNGASALSPNGKLLAVSQSNTNTDDDLYLVDTANGSARHLTPHQGQITYEAIGFSADSRRLYVRTNAEREFLNLAAIDVASGKLSYLHAMQNDVEAAVLSPDARRLAFTVNRDGYGDLVVWELNGLRPVALPALPRGLVSLGNFTRDGGRLAVSMNTPTRNGNAWLLDLARKKAAQVTRSSLAGIDSSTFVEPALIRYPTFDGRQIPAFLYLPQNAPQNHSVPVILSVHGGPESQERPFFISLYQYFLSRGYAVLAPNIRGSAGYGKTYLDMDNGPKRWDALKDLAAAADWIGKHPALDGRRIAIMGGSYGGFATLAMLTHYPDRFAAGVNMFGIADFKTFLARTAPFRRALRIPEYGDPEKDSAFLDAISPLRHADSITAPLLVIQGANDPRVPESESRQIVDRVKQKGGAVDYLLFPDEGHGIAKLPNRIRAYEAVVAFLNKHLRGERK